MENKQQLQTFQRSFGWYMEYTGVLSSHKHFKEVSHDIWNIPGYWSKILERIPKTTKIWIFQ